MLAVAHERRTAARRARLPGADGRARPLRLRVGDEVARGPRADHVRRLRPVLGPARLGRRGADQDDVPHRHPAAARHGWPPARSPSPASPGRSTAASTGSRSASTAAPGRRPASARTTPSTRGASGSPWDATPGNHASRSAPPMAPEPSKRTSGTEPFPTVRPDGTSVVGHGRLTLADQPRRPDGRTREPTARSPAGPTRRTAP